MLMKCQHCENLIDKHNEENSLILIAPGHGAMYFCCANHLYLWLNKCRDG